jgi:RHS repeat-associated protein
MQGQYDDGDIGLYYNTFRYYDYDAGRFATEDPIGLEGGHNLYRYPSNPLTAADPLGLTSIQYYPDDDYDYEGHDVNSGYFGGGVALSGHVGAIGGSLHLGVASGADGQFCIYFSSCTRIGPGLYVGIGLEGVAGAGSCASTKDQLSGKTVGAAVDVGLAASGSGTIAGNESGGAVGGGRWGLGAGFSIGGEICEQHAACW